MECWKNIDKTINEVLHKKFAYDDYSLFLEKLKNAKSILYFADNYERNSPEVKSRIKKHDLTISKGQGNYDGLSEFQGIFYMLMVKCPVIAEDINANVRDVVLLYR